MAKDPSVEEIQQAAPAAPLPAAPRVLPPVDEMTDPRDVAEALRQVGARKAREAAESVPGARAGS